LCPERIRARAAGGEVLRFTCEIARSLLTEAGKEARLGTFALCYHSRSGPGV
jgi:hypothetical protein